MYMYTNTNVIKLNTREIIYWKCPIKPLCILSATPKGEIANTINWKEPNIDVKNVQIINTYTFFLRMKYVTILMTAKPVQI